MDHDLARALTIADFTTAEPRHAKAFAGPRASRFGAIYTFASGEQRQLRALKELIVDYIEKPTPARPLCLAIFGPPGSGKSFAAKEICSQARRTSRQRENLPLTAVNMTQADAESVSRVLARIAGEQDAATVPVLFFDEFDAPRDGAPYGWLSWFLAPMHDGEFLHDGTVARLTRAVFMFAGGTASTMEAFSAQRSPDFRSAKGPDFISRLRGYLDVQGPNEPPRAIRRAIILRSELKKRLTARQPHVRLATDAKEVLISLLSVGRYRHGARSIAAILEMSAIPRNSTALSWDMLPENHLLKLHVDRGPLDAERLGGPIALSGYTSRKDLDPARECCVSVAEALWNDGATLAYVWVPGKKENELMEGLTRQLKGRAVEPRKSPRDRKHPAPWLLGYMSRDMPMRGVDKLVSRDDRLRCGLQVTPQPPVTAAERKQLGNQKWKISMVSRFRRRFAIAEASVARFVIGGWQKGHRSRVPGIAEEVMLTLAFRRPVYIAGGFGGAATDLGALLGLSDVRTRGIPPSFEPYEHDDEVKSMAEMFQPPPLMDLPVASTAIVNFLKAHAIGGPLWPDNGLSRYENKRLFLSTDKDEVIGLVVQGLRNWEKAQTSQR